MSEQGEAVARGIRELGEERDRLAGENARLRGEVEAHSILHSDLEQTTTECERVTGERDRCSANYHALEVEAANLTADLARVTGERDTLARLARNTLSGPPEDDDAEERRLRAAIAACAPPASGEEIK
jgi:predicted RNase H-like nuclease (RuvC/YqgF family)